MALERWHRISRYYNLTERKIRNNYIVYAAKILRKILMSKFRIIPHKHDKCTKGMIECRKIVMRIVAWYCQELNGNEKYKKCGQWNIYMPHIPCYRKESIIINNLKQNTRSLTDCPDTLAEARCRWMHKICKQKIIEWKLVKGWLTS